MLVLLVMEQEMSSRTERVIAAIAALPDKERAELKRQLARFSWWTKDEPGGADPPEMAGRDADFTLVFDGGSQGNPGIGYGSYLIVRHLDGAEQRRRLEFGSGVTSNEAEYDTLLAALGELTAWIVDLGLESSRVSVEVRGDSQLVLRQVGGQWRARDARMMERRDRVKAILSGFERVHLIEQPREESVRLLGH